MSFFDEVDEPPSTPRPRRTSGGGGRRPPGDQQTIAVRRAVLGVGILVVIIVLVLGVHSCQVSARNSSLKDYNNRVASLIQSSNNLGSQVFNLLSGAGGSADAQSLTNQLNGARQAADKQLSQAQGLDVPSQVQEAQRNLLLSLTMRRDGIAGIATQIGRALGASTSADAVNKIATDTALFYGSDAVYKTYTTTEIAGALHAAGIEVGPNGQTIEGGQFLPDLGWLSPDFIAGKLGASAATTSPSKGPIAPGTHGHSLDSVAVGGTTLDASSTNNVPASPPPTFTLNYTNSGENNETNVIAKVSVSGTSITGQATIPTSTKGQSGSVDVKLPSSPPAGNYTVTATIVPVPGEKNTSNNTLSFPVTFQ